MNQPASARTLAGEFTKFNQLCITVVTGSEGFPIDRGETRQAIIDHLTQAASKILADKQLAYPLSPKRHCVDTEPRTTSFRFQADLQNDVDGTGKTYGVIRVSAQYEQEQPTGAFVFPARVFVCGNGEAVESCVKFHIVRYFEYVLVPLFELAEKLQGRRR